MRAYGEIRLIVFQMGPFDLRTKSIVVAEWPEWESQRWIILAVDPCDELAYVYWQEQGAPALQSLT